MRAPASGPASPRTRDLGAAGGGHHDPSDDPIFLEGFISMVDDEHRKGHFPDMWLPDKLQKACLLSPDSDQNCPDAAGCAYDCGLQQALKALGYRIAVDGDYGAETRQVVRSFQMHAGLVADGIAGERTEAKLLAELSKQFSSPAQMR
jgi:hypothetical protein